MTKFFTHVKSVNYFIKYGPIHILLLFVTLLFMIYSFKRKPSEKFEKYLVYIIFSCQVILFIWYLTGANFLKEGLPLYTCRIAGIVFFISYLLKNDFLKSLGTYLGFVGGIISILSPALYDYEMLHFTNINFFIFHISLLGLSSYYIVNFKEVILKNRNKCQIAIIILLCIINWINFYLSANYAYTIEPPILNNLYSKMKWRNYFIIIMSLYQLSIVVESRIVKKIKSKS